MLKLTLICAVTFAGFNVVASLNLTEIVRNESVPLMTNNNNSRNEPPIDNRPITRSECVECTFKCCGKHYICARNCTGQPCDEDSQCGGGCCASGNCTESCSSSFELTKIQVGLVAGGSALVLSLACTCTCKCVSSRRRRKKEAQNVVVNMHVPAMQGNLQPGQQHQTPMPAYHASSPPLNPSTFTNHGYQTRFDRAGRAIQ